MKKLLKMGLRSKIKTTLLLIFLTVVSTSCLHKPVKDFPTPPEIHLKQSIVEQQYCDKQGQNCFVESSCKEWNVTEDSKWVLIQKHPLKFCHGNFGVTGNEVTLIQDYIARSQQWIKDNTKKPKGVENVEQY